MTLYDSILYVERQLYQSTKSYKKDLSDVTVTKEFQTSEGRAHFLSSTCDHTHDELDATLLCMLCAGLRWRCDVKLDGRATAKK